MLNEYSHYQLGGSLPEEAPSYVVRQADDELYSALLIGQYCYVLNARQMGKSSLRVRTMTRLQAQGRVCSEIELSGIGFQEITARQWYGGIIQELISGFGLTVNRRQWLSDRADLSPIKSLCDFIEAVLLQQVKSDIVIFIDEIDSVLNLGFSTDEFFAAIRNCYDRRASHPDYRRLTFAIIGVATPSELIQDERATPFNIGQAIELQGFTPAESEPLEAGLQGLVPHPSQVVKEILRWTGGQPFMTQKLCYLFVLQTLTNQSAAETTDETTYQTTDDSTVAQRVASLVTTQVIDGWEGRDEPEHLRTIRDRLLRNARSSICLLKRYRTLLQRGALPAGNSQTTLELKLSGLVKPAAGRIVIKNRIYQAVFDRNWVDQQLKRLANESRRSYRIPLWQALAGSAIAATFTLAIRSLGALQSYELGALDHLMRSRPTEQPDDRILLVTITEDDVKAQPQAERGAASLSHNALSQMVQKLESADPRAIGLDVYRDFPVPAGFESLATQMRGNERFYAICNYGDPGVSAPPEVPGERQGLNNVVPDMPSSSIRRQILAISDPSPCQSYYTLSWKLAAHYLGAQGIFSDQDEQGQLWLGNTAITELREKSGGYATEKIYGYQTLVNYRNTEQIAPTVSLQEVLSDRFDLQLAHDRIVLIGTVAASFNDTHWITPLHTGLAGKSKMSGVALQAHMTSQLLSAVLDDRPLIWWWSEAAESAWIVVWSGLGTVLMWRSPTSTAKVVTAIGTSLLIYSLCWLFFQSGGWLPLVPAILSSSLSEAGVVIYTYLRKPLP